MKMDKSKLSNIRCGHCQYFKHFQDSPIYEGNCELKSIIKNGIKRTRCKSFKWHERYD